MSGNWIGPPPPSGQRRLGDARILFRFDPFGIIVHVTPEDGAWAVGGFGCEAVRLFRGDPIEWRVGPWLAGYGKRMAWCRIRLRLDFHSAVKRLRKKDWRQD
jgi:hypothetical protein